MTIFASPFGKSSREEIEKKIDHHDRLAKWNIGLARLATKVIGIEASVDPLLEAEKHRVAARIAEHALKNMEV